MRKRCETCELLDTACQDCLEGFWEGYDEWLETAEEHFSAVI